MRSCKKWLPRGAGFIGAAAFIVSSAFGAPITGTVNISGPGFDDTGVAINFVPPTTVGSGATGSFAGLDGTTVGVNSLTAAEVGATQNPEPLFLTFSNGIQFTVSQIYPGIDGLAGCAATPPAAGQTCTPPPPPGFSSQAINLQNLPGGGSTASLSLTGTAKNVAGDMGTFNGFLTAQFTVPYQTLLAEIAMGPLNAPTTTWSGSFMVTPTSVVPEPASFILLGCGLIGISAIRRFRRS